MPSWIARCLASVQAWTRASGHDYLLTDDSAFELCGADYLAKAGANPRTKTNLARLELIARAHAQGYDQVVWMDADIFVFNPAELAFGVANRITFARETWLAPRGDGSWEATKTQNNCVVVCPSGDKDLALIIQTIRHVAAHHPINHNFRVGVHLIRGLHHFLHFPLVTNVGMFSNHAVLAVAQDQKQLLKAQAVHHGTPVHAANLCASDHLNPVVPEAEAHRAMDILETTRGRVINSWLDDSGPS
ncbi:MAG TPA: hypothetical protein VII73_06945 [Caulobacteraceae bacterium]